MHRRSKEGDELVAIINVTNAPPSCNSLRVRTHFDSSGCWLLQWQHRRWGMVLCHDQLHRREDKHLVTVIMGRLLDTCGVVVVGFAFAGRPDRVESVWWKINRIAPAEFKEWTLSLRR